MSSSVKAALEARKKRNEEEEKNRFSVEDALKERSTRIESTWQSSLSSLQEELNKEAETYKSLKTLSFGTDLRNVLDSTNDSRINIGNLRRKVDALRTKLGDDKTDEILSVIDQMKSGYNSYISNAKVYSSFKTETDYNQWVSDSEEYEKKKNLDLDAAQKEIEKLEAEYERLYGKGSYTSNDPYLQPNRNGVPPTADQVKKRKDQSQTSATGISATDTSSARKELEKAISEKKLYLTQAKRIQEGIRLSGVADPESEFYDLEFDKNSKYVGTKVDDWFSKLTSQYGMGYDDVVYEYINNINGIRDDINSKWRAWSTAGADAESPYVQKGYDYLTEQEVAIYNYYYAKEGKEAAEKYLDNIQETLNYRKATKRFETDLEGNTFAEIVFGVEAGLDQFGSGITNLFNFDDDYIPTSAVQMASQMVREDLGDDGWKLPEWMGGSSLGQVAYDVTSTTSNMLPSILIGAATHPVVGATLLGSSAAGNAYQEMINLGYDKEQARMYSTLVGASEASLEYFLGGISKLGGKATGEIATKLLSKIDNAFARAAIRLGGSMLSEGFEEGLQEYLDPWFKSIALNVDYEAANLDEILYSSLLGALSAFGLEGTSVVSSEISTYSQGDKLKSSGEVDRLVELGKTFSADSVAAQIAGKVTKDTGAYTIGRLFNEVGASLSSQNISDITNALVKRGVDKSNADTISKWMNKVIEGGNLTRGQQAALENNPVLAEVLYGTFIQPNSTVMQRNQAVAKLKGIETSTGIDRNALEAEQTPEAISQAITQRMENESRGYSTGRGLSEAQLAEIDKVASEIKATIGGSSKPSSAKIAKVDGKVSDTGATFVKSTGEEVSIKSIASIDAKNKIMKLELSNGTIVDSNDISYGNEKQGLLYESVLLMGYDVPTANAIVQGYTESSPTSVSDYLIGTNEAFNYGWGHISEKARGGSGYSKLTKAEKAYAVKLGEDARSADDTAREAKIPQKQASTAKKKPKGGYGARLSVDKNTVTDRVKKSAKALDAVAKALKLNITIADLGGNSYGFYRSSTNELVVDVNAGGNGKHTLLFTASHELVHYVRNWSPQKFTVLADFLMEQYAAKGENIDALIQEEIDKAYKATRGKHEMTFDEAYEEVVAQAMQRFLTDSNFIEHLASLQKKDASLAKRLISKLKEILNSIRAAYKGMDTNDRASQAVKEMGEAVDELYAKMEEGLIAASEASQSIGARNLEDFSEAKNTNGEDLFQYKAMEADEKAYRQMLKKHGIMSEQDINKLFNTIDKAMVIIKNNLEVLDYAWEADIDDRSFSPVKPNSDNLYKVSLDFSTLCRKRILQQVIQTQLQDALNKPLSREESIAIRDELMKIQEEGRQIEIACALCYVESARMKSPAQIKKFLKNREAVIKEFLASKSGGDIKQKIKQAEVDARERLHKENPNGIKGKDGTMLDPRNASLKAMPKKYADEIRSAKKSAKEAYKPTVEEQKLIDAASSMSVTDFTSPEGLENLAKNYPVLFDAYTSYVRNATKSKGIEKDTWWRAGDSNSIGDTLIANMNRENGLRSQSWSDFQVIHLLDYIAATIELSTRNAKEQAYSKVPDYIDLMGNTGVMLNMSLIPTAQFKGKLEYDSVEGMAYEKALELRDKYHATAGTICIGISNEQIKMLLADSTIDYVIPYHKSGMAAHIRKLMHIPTWSEYEDYQSEKELSRDEAVKQAKKYGVTLLSESDPNYHKHTAFSEWFDIKEAKQIAKQENAFPTDAKLQKKLGVMYGGYMAMKSAADNYLKLCAERGLSPKFSHENANFSTEDNYWKLLIDRKMVDNVTGEIIEQQAIKPIFDETEVLRILNDELKRYPSVKADQDYATRTVVEKFLSGKMNNRLDADTVAAIMQKPVDNITTTNIVASEDDVKAQYTDKSFSGRYSYEELTSKPDMKLTAISNIAPNNRANVVSDAKKNAAKIGKFNPKNGSVSVLVDDINVDVILGTDGLKHGLRRKKGLQNNANAIVTLKAGEILKNSIRVNELTPSKENASGSYVLIGAARSESGELYVVRFVVNQFSHELTSMDVLYAINAKKELAVRNAPRSTAKPLSVTSSYISVAQLLDFVNNHFPDILPESVLKHYGYDARPEGDLGDDALYQYADSETEQKVISGLATHMVGSTITDRYATYTAERMERELRYSSAEHIPDYAKSYITWVDPFDFIYATSSSEQERQHLKEEAGELDAERLSEETQPIYLRVDFETGQILGHEGRHRMLALQKAGIEKVAVIIDATNDDYHNTKPIEFMKLKGQRFRDGNGLGFMLHNMLPLSQRYADKARKYFTKDPKSGIRFQYKDEDAIDNRTLLAKSLEGAAKTDLEKQKLKEYRSKIDLINSEEKKLRELREQIKEISFSKGKRDTEKLKSLQFEANQAANRINVYDKQLLRLEATKPIADVLAREKEMAKKRQKQKDMQLLADYKEKSKATVRELLERNQESRKKAIEGREKTFMRNKIKGVVNDLNQLLLKGTKDKHVMIGLQKAVASALDAVNMDTVGADERIAKYDALIAKAKDPDVIASLTATRDRIAEQGDKMSEKLAALKSSYADIKNSNDPLIANSHDEVIENKIESVVNSVGNTPLRDMTLEQLEDVYDLYKMVLTTIRNSNKAFKLDKAESIASLGNNVMGEIHSIAGEKKYVPAALEWLKKFGWSSLKPTQAFELIGSGTFKRVFANVRAGEDTWAVDVNEAREYYREKSSKYGYDSWDFKQRFEFTSKSGKKFSLSLEQIMSLYAYSKRKQADLHLEQGGFVLDDAIEVVEKKLGFIPVKYKVNTANAYSISKKELGNIIGTLSDRQRFFVDEMQTYLSDVMGAKGNEVSLEMYGVKLFKEQFYFPLKSAKQFMFEQSEVAGEVKIKNSGFSKETVAKANNPIILSNFMDVWSNHVNDMSMYHAFVLPLEDFNRVFNYKTPTSDKYNPESVKSYLQNAYGTQPVDYIKQLITDLNGGARSDASAGFVNKGLSLFKKGAVFASASVVIQQPSAIARAFAYINPKYFVTAKNDITKHSRDWEECKKYAPVARIKEMGYFDTNVGPQTTEWITAKEYKGFAEKIKGLKDSNYRDELLSKAPALADEITWTHIWNAVKKETASTTNLKVGSEEFLKRAGERFTEVIVNTQVYDSVLSRSGMMRSKDTGVKMATAFMAEPTTSLNMIVNAFVQAKRGNKKFAGNIVGGVASSIILNSILVSLVYAARDDDEDETYIEKYLGSLTSELLDGFFPITYIPFAKDLWSIAQGYNVERSDMSVVSKLWQSFEELFDDKKTALDKVLDFSGSVANLFGLPLKNITRDAKAAYNTFAKALSIEYTTKAGVIDSAEDALRNAVPLLGRFYKEDTKAQKLYDAILGGDATEIRRARSQFKDQKAIDTALRKALRENDPRIKKAAQARIDGDMTLYKKIALEIKAEGYFSQDNIVGAINSEINELTKKEASGESKSVPQFTTSDLYKAAANGDYADVEVVKEYLIQSGKTESQIASSLNSYIKDAYEKGEISESKAISIMTSYGGKDYDEADLTIRYIDFKADYPEYEDIISEAKYEKYLEPMSNYNGISIESSGISISDYAEYCELSAECTGTDNDGDGKTDSGSKKVEILRVIHSLPITSYQKDALYFLNGWSAKTLNEAPWH